MNMVKSFLMLLVKIENGNLVILFQNFLFYKI